MRAWLLALMLALSASEPAKAQAPAAESPLVMNTLRVGGANRSVGLYVPRSLRTGHAAPLIIALHGRYSSAQALHALSHLSEVAEQNGAIVAYPETAGISWNDGGFGPLARSETPADDAGLINAAINAIAQDYALDRDRVFVVGYDSGGAMAYALACSGAVHAAGIAAISAPLFNLTTQNCTGAHATPMLIMHGDRDLTFPAAGMRLDAPQSARVLSSADTIAFWRRVNGCALGAGGGDYYSSDCTGAPFAFISVGGGEHDWFHEGAHYRLNQRGVDAAQAVGQFFFTRATFQIPAQHARASIARAYTVYVPPSYNPARPTPLVLVLHGQGGTPQGMAQISHMNAIAARHGFIVVYPQGLNHEWNAFFDLVRQPALAPQDDINFLKTLTEDLGVDLNIDRRRMYVSGFSNGAFMTLRLTCSASDYFAGFASVAAELYTQLTSRCQGNGAPILLINGTADPMVRYNGVTRGGVRLDASNIGNGAAGPSANRFSIGNMGGAAPSSINNPLGGDRPTLVTLSAFETASFFVRRNRCDATGVTTTFPQSGRSPGTSATRFSPHKCANNNDVAFYVIEGGGHEWPGGPQRAEETFGKTNFDIDAGEEIWRFFAAHSLDRDPR
jgi:polyhydroxybutyrate depolymerase